MVASVQASAEKSASSVVAQAKDIASKVSDSVQSAVENLTSSDEGR